ncbi:hypothetical protein IPA_03230 [Ignicoccus pacificus DSM 13166]|uniref:DEAD/DEAH box helicase n=1 Tax=Ignicoccus pacificus DSM 13166 TaxID=940294 RepID=A0A977KAX2_9CREN|nr:hypothetical protein IPA_03230 [Ignicoccus pacificus DSM 13166]
MRTWLFKKLRKEDRKARMIYHALVQDLVLNDVATMRTGYPLHTFLVTGFVENDGQKVPKAAYFVSPLPVVIPRTDIRLTMPLEYVLYSFLYTAYRLEVGLPVCLNDSAALVNVPQEFFKNRYTIKKTITEWAFEDPNKNFEEALISLLLDLVDSLLLRPTTPDVSWSVDPLLSNVLEYISDRLGKIINIEKVKRMLKREGLSGLHFKSFHGLLVKQQAGASALPDYSNAFNVLLTPSVIELPSAKELFEYDYKEGFSYDFSQLRNKLEASMTSFLGGSEEVKKIVGALFETLKELGYTRASAFQYSSLLKLLGSDSSKEKLITVVSPTGSGKTLVFSLYSMLKVLKYKLEGKYKKVIFVYPRKTLEVDQLQKIVELILTFNLKLQEKKINKIIKIGIRDGDSPQRLRKKEEIRGIKIKFNNKEYTLYQGIHEDKEANFLDNRVLEYLYVWDAKENSKERDPFEDEETDIVITNHSMLYKKAMEKKGALKNVGLIVIDEAHVVYKRDYLSTINGALARIYQAIAGSILERETLDELSISDELVNKFLDKITNELEVMLSSATAGSNVLLKNSFFTQNIQAIVDLGPVPLSSLEDFASTILGKRVVEGYRRRNAFMTLTPQPPSKTLKSPYKLKVISAVSTFHTKKYLNTFGEILIDFTHATLALERSHQLVYGKKKKYVSLAFINSKKDIKDIMKMYVERYLAEERDLADRALLTVDKESWVEWSRYPETFANTLEDKQREGKYAFILNSQDYPFSISLIDSKIRRSAIKRIGIVLQEAAEKSGNAFEWINTDPLRDFQTLSLYLNVYDIKALRSGFENPYLLITSSTNNYIAQNVLNAELWAYDVTRTHDLNYNEDRNKLEEALKRGRASILYHHADLKKDIRSYLESEIKKKPPLVLLATSTLEVGVDLPNIPFVVQGGIDYVETADFLQRVGRSGRAGETFFISLATIVLKNRGVDSTIRNDEELIEYAVNLRLGLTASPLSDPIITTKQTISLIYNFNKNKYPDIMDIIRDRDVIGFVKSAAIAYSEYPKEFIPNVTRNLRVWLIYYATVKDALEGATHTNKISEIGCDEVNEKEIISLLLAKLYSPHITMELKSLLRELLNTLEIPTNHKEGTKFLLMISSFLDLIDKNDKLTEQELELLAKVLRYLAPRALPILPTYLLDYIMNKTLKIIISNVDKDNRELINLMICILYCVIKNIKRVSVKVSKSFEVDSLIDRVLRDNFFGLFEEYGAPTNSNSCDGQSCDPNSFLMASRPLRYER